MAQAPKKIPKPDFDTLYMERNALAFLRAWPNVAEGLQPCYRRLYEARIIATPPSDETGQNTRWPSGPSLTYLGNTLKQIVDAQTFNFFTADSIYGLWGDVFLLRRPDTLAFVRLFKTSKSDRPDWTDPTVKAYVEWIKEVGPPQQTYFMDTPINRVRLQAELSQNALGGFLGAVDRLKTALFRNANVRYQVELRRVMTDPFPWEPGLAMQSFDQSCYRS